MNSPRISVAEAAFDSALERLHSLEQAEPKSAPPLSLESFEKTTANDGESRDALAIYHRAPSIAVSQVVPLTATPTLREALVLLRSGKLTTRELLEKSLSAMSETANLGAIVAIDEEAVRKAADLMDLERSAGGPTGALDGIPISVKDVIDVAYLPTRAGSKAYYDLPVRDASSVDRLRAAGALIFAKAATHEFALGVTTPQCRNPYDATRISGGSSGGSAIAVATGVGLASLGTDTRASLRVPSSLCGVVGYKPTFGIVPTDGIVPLSWTIDHIGPITRTVADAAIMLNVLAGREVFSGLDSGTRLDGVKVGVVAATLSEADPEIAAATEAALAELIELGAQLFEVDTPSSEDFNIANDIGLLISRSEATTFHRSNGTDLDLCIPEVRDQLVAALKITAPDYLDAQRQRSRLAARLLAAFEQCDILVMPTVPVATPPWLDYEKHLLSLSRNAIPWSLIGSPAVSLPCGATSEGMPIGIQMVAGPGRDARLLRTGIALEEAIAKRAKRGD